MLLVIFQMGGAYLIFCVELWEAKKEAAEFMDGVQNDRDKIISLSFQLHQGKIVASDLVFEDDNEFSYQGRMYDVISTQKYKDHIVFKCYTDSKETILNKDLSDNVDAGRDKTSQHKEDSLIKVLFQDLIVNEFDVNYFFYKNTTPTALRYQSIQQAAIYKAIVSPPPELCFS